MKRTNKELRLDCSLKLEGALKINSYVKNPSAADIVNKVMMQVTLKSINKLIKQEQDNEEDRRG